jgi:hypothetical protein
MRVSSQARSVEALPALPLNRQLVPLLAPGSGTSGHLGTIPGNEGQNGQVTVEPEGIDAISAPVNKKGPLSTRDSGPLRIGPAGFEPTTSCTPSTGAFEAITARESAFRSYEFHPSHSLHVFDLPIPITARESAFRSYEFHPSHSLHVFDLPIHTTHTVNAV